MEHNGLAEKGLTGLMLHIKMLYRPPNLRCFGIWILKYMMTLIVQDPYFGHLGHIANAGISLRLCTPFTFKATVLALASVFIVGSTVIKVVQP